MAKITINEATGECTILLERKDEFRRKRRGERTTITSVGAFRTGELICNDKFHLIMVRGDE